MELDKSANVLMLLNTGIGRGPAFTPMMSGCWFRTYWRGKCVPFEPAYATSSTVLPPSSRSSVRFHDCRYCVGLVAGWALGDVVPEVPAFDAGNGLDTVSRSGF